jgi:hypothetical protein
MAHVVEIEEPLYSMGIALFSSSAVMSGTQGFAKTAQEF